MDDKRVRLGASNPAMLPKAGQRNTDDNNHSSRDRLCHLIALASGTEVLIP
jgi:hypothetical protein